MNSTIVQVNQLKAAYSVYATYVDGLEVKLLDYLDPDASVRAHTTGWLMSDMSSCLAVIIVFFLWCLTGPIVMNALNIRGKDPRLMKFFYNMSQVMLCSYMTIEAFLLAYRNNYTVTPGQEFSITAPPVANLLHLFYLSKYFDFFDTFFIVIGKKTEQLSLLHVYHHATILAFYWLNLRVNYDGDVFLTIILNGAIHTVMYTYYFVSMHTKIPNKMANDESKGKSVPIAWKSLLTLSQMFQFCIMMTQAIYIINNQVQVLPNPKITKVYLGYIMSLLGLFMKFFIESYMVKKPVKKGGKAKVL